MKTIIHITNKICNILLCLLIICYQATAYSNTITLKPKNTYATNIKYIPIYNTRPFTTFTKHWNILNANIQQKYGLRLFFSYIPLFQYATNFSNNKLAGSADVNLTGRWQLLNRNQANTGTLVFSFENRHRLASVTPVRLTNVIGTLWDVGSSFNSQPLALIRLLWKQELLDNHLVIHIGKIDTSDYIDTNKFQLRKLYFLNASLADNPTIAYPENGLGGMASIYIRHFYLHVGLADLNAAKTSMNFNSFFDEREFFKTIEMGTTPNFKSIGKGDYHVSFWYVDAQKYLDNPSGYGITVAITQELDKYLTVFFRYSYAEKNILTLNKLITGGLVIKHPFSIQSGVLGIGVANGKPSDSSNRSQQIAEGFYRIQLTPHIQLTPDVQLLFNTENYGPHKPAYVIGLRTRIYF